MADEPGFASATEAEAAFYQALEAADLALMQRVWAPLATVSCVHPGRAPLIGRTPVMHSWEVIFAAGPSLHVRYERLQRSRGSGLAIHLVHEYLQLSGGEAPQPPVVATNSYQRIGTHWFMTGHHGSPTLAVQLAAEAAEPPGAGSAGAPVVH